MQFVEPHQNHYRKNKESNYTIPIIKWLGYLAGTLAGWRSQLAIAAGSGAAVATDILTFGITVFRPMFTIVLDKTSLIIRK
jgi:hypothetical protein